MFSPKYLIGFLGVTGVAGGITASTLLSGKTSSNEEKRDSVEVFQEKAKALPTISSPTVVKQESEKSEFKGKLVFSRDLESSFPFGRSGEVFYAGKIFKDSEYKEEKDDEDPEKYITVDISLQKFQQAIEIGLKELNEKIKDKFKDRNDQNLPLIKLEKSLEEFKNDFENIFNAEIYQKLLEKIEKLKG